jgi:hypothetical protein
MYLKLAFRNAKRSVFDYMLYIATMTILIAVMHISNCIAVFGDMQLGFQTMSLPLLIALIMVVLVNYINNFMMKQRAKEFASYLLLGMEKNKLSQMFLLEFCCIGAVCLLLGWVIGTGVYLVVFSSEFQSVDIQPLLTAKSVLITICFFVIVEAVSAFCIRRKIYKLQIYELMNEKRRNQTLGGKKKTAWGLSLVISCSCVFLMLCGLVFFPENIMAIIISFISIPMLYCIFAFYKWMYAYLASRRLLQSENLYQGNRLYRIAELTRGTKTNALMNTIFCICLLFSAVSFVFGTLLLNMGIELHSATAQQWMGFLQISICIIFMAIYFSILSLQQIIELKQQTENIRILHYMGKNQAQIKSLIKSQVMLKLFVPVFMCIILLVISTPFINYKINMAFPAITQNSLITAVGWFLGCFALLYFCYFSIVYAISRRYLKTVINF